MVNLIIHGQKYSGKSALANMWSIETGAKQYHFAKTLKRMLVVLLTDAGYTDVEAVEFLHGKRKEEPLIELGTGISGRTLMEYLGTEFGRGLNPDLWINIVSKSIKGDEYVVIDDCRYVNEVEYAKRHGFLCVKIVRPDLEKPVTHSSDAGLPDHYFDYVIINNLDALTYKRAAQQFCKTIASGGSYKSQYLYVDGLANG